MHPDRNYFQIYKDNCDCFIETGTYKGDGITLAVLAGFTEIHSIDIEDQLPLNYQHGLKDIHRYIGDSPKVLDELLPRLKDKKIMFWLDAHSQMFEGEEENYPLLRELQVIRKHREDKRDVILIDDFIYMSHPNITGLDRDEIEAEIRATSMYHIEYLSNPIINNILLAR